MNTEQTIYMDYQASTPIRESVLEAMMPYLIHEYGNPHSSDHFMGWNASKAIDNAKKKVANAIGAEHEEIIFTSGATESNNHAILSVARAMRGQKKRILVGATEHKCVLESARFASDEYGLSLEVIPVNNQGLIDVEVFTSLLNDDVGLVSVMLVNNEVGTIQDIKTLTKLSKRFGATFHCDAAQGLIATDIDVSELGVDLLSLSAHKIYGPKGVGALYVSSDLVSWLLPIMHGGPQQSGLRAGTLSTPQCVGFGTAVESLVEMESERARMLQLKKLFISELSRSVEFEINGPSDFSISHPGNINLYFPTIEASSLLLRLQPKICASSGSACNTGFIEPSYVIKALGYDRERAENSVRFSLGAYSSENEILRSTAIISDLINSIDSS